MCCVICVFVCSFVKCVCIYVCPFACGQTVEEARQNEEEDEGSPGWQRRHACVHLMFVYVPVCVNVFVPVCVCKRRGRCQAEGG